MQFTFPRLQCCEFQPGNNIPRQLLMGHPANPHGLCRNDNKATICDPNTLNSQSAFIRGAIEILEAEHRAILSAFLRNSIIQGKASSLPSAMKESSVQPKQMSLSTSPSNKRELSSELDHGATFVKTQAPIELNSGSVREYLISQSELVGQLQQQNSIPSNQSWTEVSQPCSWPAPPGAAFFASLSSKQRPEETDPFLPPPTQGLRRGSPSRVAGKAVLDTAVSPDPRPPILPVPQPPKRQLPARQTLSVPRSVPLRRPLAGRLWGRLGLRRARNSTADRALLRRNAASDSIRIAPARRKAVRRTPLDLRRFGPKRAEPTETSGGRGRLASAARFHLTRPSRRRQAARAIYRARPPAADLRGGRARDLSDALAARHGVTAKTIRDVWNRGCAAAVACITVGISTLLDQSLSAFAR